MRKLNKTFVDKTEISFSRNVDFQMQLLLQERLNFKVVSHHDKYLGVPTFISQSKKVIFNFITDKGWKRLRAGRNAISPRQGSRFY